MRVSADPADPDYNRAAEYLEVRLDGALVPCCITADDERGEVLCYEIDQGGHICFDPITRSARTRTMRGQVEILIDPRVPAHQYRMAQRFIESRKS